MRAIKVPFGDPDCVICASPRGRDSGTVNIDSRDFSCRTAVDVFRGPAGPLP